MKRIVLYLTFLVSFNAFGSHTIGVGGFMHSHLIEGTRISDDLKGKIISNNNLNYSLNYLWSLNRFIRLKGSFSQKSIEFEDEQEVIINNEVFEAQTYSLGLKFIFARWGALSIDQVHDLDISYKVTDSNQIEVIDSTIDYLRITYHQLLYQMNSLIFALDIGHEVNSGNSYLVSRSASFGTGLLKWNLHGWGVDLYYSKKSISKESDKQNYSHSETLSGLDIYFYL